MGGPTAPITVAAAFVVGAIWMFAVEWYRPKAKTVELDAMTWKEALWMGLYQCLWALAGHVAERLHHSRRHDVGRPAEDGRRVFLPGRPFRSCWSATVYKFIQKYHDLNMSS